MTDFSFDLTGVFYLFYRKKEDRPVFFSVILIEK